ncbi:hypothetical protein EIP86_009368 [Pleurotus ostreatoroseus]|nr:hypothetical protein EIP86_009368 [Pleurotus ostreatoroseus]
MLEADAEATAARTAAASVKRMAKAFKGVTAKAKAKEGCNERKGSGNRERAGWESVGGGLGLYTLAHTDRSRALGGDFPETEMIMLTGKTRSALQDVVTREYTIHLHKRVHNRAFKKRAPHAVKSVVEFAQKAMGTADVRIDPKLNQELWSRGIKSVPHRIRVKLERKRNDEEGAKEKLFTYASYVFVDSFKGLETTVVEAE